ncbi:hypothetical protein METHP14_880022 [Pseudomonas sp. P14-2025]
MLAQRDLVPNGSATAEALDRSLKRWVVLTRHLDDGAVPIDNNQCAYLKDVLKRLPTQRTSEIGHFLPHQRGPAAAS